MKSQISKDPTRSSSVDIGLLQGEECDDCYPGWSGNDYSGHWMLVIQLVFAVEGRQSLIAPAHQEEVNKYITGIVKNKRSKMLAINGMPDHQHILIGLHPSQAISDLVRDIKADSNEWMNNKRWVRGRFSRQEGYGAFSYSGSQLDRVVRYVMNQREHHAKQTFKGEYLSLLRKFDIAIKEEYVFQWV